MIDLNKLIDILKDFLAKITSKRLAAYALFLMYMSYVFSQVIGQKAVNTLDIIILECVVFIGVPALVLVFLLISLTKVGGGDDMLPQAEQEMKDPLSKPFLPADPGRGHAEPTPLDQLIPPKEPFQ